MEDAKWYFTHETEEDRLWYRTFFAMCRKFGVLWSKASEEQKCIVYMFICQHHIEKNNIIRRKLEIHCPFFVHLCRKQRPNAQKECR